MKKDYTKVLTKAALVAVLLFSLSTKMFAIVSAPSSCTASIGSPANGTSHHITITWSSVSGATAYQSQYSSDSTNWLPLDSALVTSYDHNTGSIGNLPFYYRVRTIQGSSASAWTDATPFPIYSACNVPLLPQLDNPTGHSIALTILPELPDSNPSYTTYSVYCATTSQYLQADGTLGATEVFQTRSAWGTINVNGLTSSTSYCFYAIASNQDGNTQIAAGSSLISQPFNSNVLVQNGTSSQWYIPQKGIYGCSDESEAPGYPIWTWTDTAGCDATGAIYYQGDENFGYEGCLVSSPKLNLSGKDSCVITLNLTNNDDYTTDNIEFSMWVGTSGTNGTFLSSSATSINGVTGNSIYFTTARSCVPITVTFNLTGTGFNNSFCNFEISSSANEISYSSAGYYALIDDINIGQGPPSTACLTTLTSVGVDEVKGESGFTIYPNPAKDNLTLNSKGEIKSARISVINVLGQEIYTQDVTGISNGSNIQIPLTSAAGIYFLQIQDETGKWVGKFVKE